MTQFGNQRLGWVTPGSGIGRVAGSRRNPVAGLVALVATLAGLGLMVYGFLGPGSSPWASSGDAADLFSTLLLVVLGLALIVPTWVVFARVTVSHRRARAQAVAEPVQAVTEPPGDRDPTLVSLLIGNGHPARRAIAATILDLARRHQLSINEYGPKVVIQLPSNPVPATRGERLVLDALRARASEGRVEGPPIWPQRITWWRDFEQDGMSRAIGAGLLAPRVPPIGAMLVGILTATGLALIFWSHTAVFVGAILLANGLPQVLARVSGYHLTVDGLREKARWVAFGRYLEQDRTFCESGPAAIAMWGPNLSYGAALGDASRAAALLTPGARDPDPAPSGTTISDT